MIAELDKDGSGQIEFDEFFYMMTTRPSDNETREEVHKIFITFDVQKTGTAAVTKASSHSRTSEKLPKISENSPTIPSCRR
jgi:Ca2+-binding EF-hand superfamily protein